MAGAAIAAIPRVSCHLPAFRTASTHHHRAPRLVVVVRARAMSAAAAAASGGNRAVVWFRGTDLRLHDNPIVHEAAKRVQAGQVSEVRWPAGELLSAACTHCRACMRACAAACL